MTSTPQPQVVKVRALGALISVIPRVLGFPPTQSIVVVCLHDSRRLGLVARFDLEVAADPTRLLATVEHCLARDHADAALIAIFSDEPRDETRDGIEQMPHLDIVDTLMLGCSMPMVDVVLAARDGRWWSYLCDGDPDCNCGSGTPADGSSPDATAVAAAYAMAGHGVLPDRDAVVQSVTLALDRAATKQARGAIATVIRRHRQHLRPKRRLMMRALHARLVEARDDPRSQLSDGDLAEFAALSADVIVRDEVLAACANRDVAETTVGLLRDIAVRTPPPYDAPVCAMLAWVAYSCGDGVVANVALDRALDSDPEYSLALLTADALDRQFSPEWLREVMRQAADDMRDDDGAG